MQWWVWCSFIPLLLYIGGVWIDVLLDRRLHRREVARVNAIYKEAYDKQNPPKQKPAYRRQHKPGKRGHKPMPKRGRMS